MDLVGGRMSFVSLATIRSRFSTKIGSLAGFTVSRNPYDDTNRNPQTVAHKRFSVGIVACESMEEQRQVSSVGIMCRTRIRVKFPYRLRPKDQVLDYDNSLDSAELVIRSITVRAAPLHTDLHISFRDFSHEIVNSGEYILNQIEFDVLHEIST